MIQDAAGKNWKVETRVGGDGTCDDVVVKDCLKGEAILRHVNLFIAFSEILTVRNPLSK